MIFESSHPSPHQEPSPFVSDHKKSGVSHRRRIRMTDPKPIQNALQYDQHQKQPQRSYGITPTVVKQKSRIVEERSRTEAKKKEKESRMYEGGDQNNIFKQPSGHIVSRLSKQDIRLPLLQKRRGEDIEDPQSKRVVVRIALDKLKKLPTEQVKKRFLQKYQFSPDD